MRKFGRRRGERGHYEASKGINVKKKKKVWRDEIFKDEDGGGWTKVKGTKKFKHLQVIRHPDLTRASTLCIPQREGPWTRNLSR